MIKIDKDNVTITRDTWEELRNDEYFRELIEVLEDSEDLQNAIDETDELLDFDEYDKVRMKRINA